MKNNPEIIKTGDGSYSLYLPELNETYHSRFGAIQESEHVYIQSGLKFLKNKKEIQILEIGFGTGLNAFLTLLFQQKNNFPNIIYYDSLEKFPLPENFIHQLNYYKNSKEKKIFEKLHFEAWNSIGEIIAGKFFLKKISEDLLNFIPEKLYNLIYFDAFAPDKQPEMWSESVMKKLYQSLSAQGVLVTYSAKGSVRRTMQAVGFSVERIPGPPGKREMLRALKS